MLRIVHICTLSLFCKAHPVDTAVHRPEYDANGTEVKESGVLPLVRPARFPLFSDSLSNSERSLLRTTGDTE